MRKTCATLTVGMIAASFIAHAEVRPNPYQGIVDRNTFGLKAPPPKVEAPEAPPAPPAPAPKVILTGITSLFSIPRALLEITETEPGKAAAGGGAKKPVLREGERLGSIEVLSIDIQNSIVKIRNNGVETNLTFEVPKPAGGPGTPGVPTPLPGSVPSFTALPPGGGAGPTIVSPGANNANSLNNGGSGITMLGGGTATPSANPAMNRPYPGGTTGIPSPTANYGTPNPASSGYKVIPPRTVRTETAAPGQPAPISAEAQEAMAQIHNQTRDIHGLPPLPTRSGGPPSPPGFSK